MQKRRVRRNFCKIKAVHEQGLFQESDKRGEKIFSFFKLIEFSLECLKIEEKVYRNSD